MHTYRILGPGDEPALELFLARHADSSMILRSNLRLAGIVERGQPLQGTYVAAFDDAGEVAGVVCRYWNGNLLYQAPHEPAELARQAARLIGRPVQGFLGPWDQTVAIRGALGLADTPAQFDKCEDLFALNLDDLSVPQPIRDGAVRCRLSQEGDLDLLTEWRLAYNVETLHAVRDSQLAVRARAEMERLHAARALWVLEAAGQPAAMSAMGAQLPDSVQVAGVWTPPEQRRRGYARAVVAGSLLETRRSGVSRAILFANDPHAQRAYVAVGFRRIGDYALVLYGEPQQVRI